MTANAAGKSSPMPPRLAQPVTMNPLVPWWLVIPQFVESSVPLSPRSKKAASSRLPKPPSALEAEFALQLRAHGVTGWTREFQAIPTRRFRLDFAWPDQKVGVELDGGTWSNGRHSRGKGYDSDCEKLALLQLAGWTIFKATATHLKDGSTIRWTMEALGVKPCSP